MKALVGAFNSFNQEKTLVGTFSVMVETDCETDGSSAALIVTGAVLQCCSVQAADSSHPRFHVTTLLLIHAFNQFGEF